VPCRLEEKDAMLYAFLRCHPGRTLVFLNSVSSVRRLANVFGLLQCTPVALHAQMQQKQRLRSLERFAANPAGLLLATDVAARGLDIVGVQHVIHYHVPRTSEVRFLYLV
jgi:ATP-dependent RNA helicase DDX24/MAK5